MQYHNMRAVIYVLYFTVLIAALPLAVVAQSGCDQLGPSASVQFTTLRDCVNSVSLTNDIQASTIKSLRQIYQQYVFRNDAINAVGFNISVDIDAELANFAQRQFNSLFDFHQQLTRLFNLLRDWHTQFVSKTCARFLAVSQPFRLSVKPDPVNGSLQFYTQELPPSIQFVASDHARLQGVDVKPFLNKQVTAINGRDPYSVLFEYARDEVGWAQHVSSRFNLAVKTAWFFRPLVNFMLPTSDTVEYKFADGTSMTAYWLGVSAIKITDFAACSVDQTQFNYDLLARMFAFNEWIEAVDSSNLVQPESVTQVGATPDVQLFVPQSSPSYATLRIRTLQPEETNNVRAPQSAVNNKQWLAAIRQSFGYLKDKNIQNLIVDVRGNQGGMICLMQWLSKYIAPAVWHPEHNQRVIHSPLNDATTAFNFFGDPSEMYDENDKAFSGSSWYSPGEDLQALSGNVTRWSKRAHSHGCSWLPDYDLCETAPVTLTPQQIILLTDGLCGSACGMFVKNLQELGRARVVTVGGDGSGPMEPTAFAGGSASSSDNLAQFILNSDIASDIVPLPLYKSTLKFTQSSYLSRIKGQEDLSLQWAVKRADFHINTWDFEQLAPLYASTAQFFSTCADWEVKVDPNACQTKDHRYYGYKCNRGSFDTSQCVPAYCADGYYEDPTGSCVSRNCLSAATKIGLIIFFSALFLILIAAGIVLLVSWMKKCFVFKKYAKKRASATFIF